MWDICIVEAVALAAVTRGLIRFIGNKLTGRPGLENVSRDAGLGVGLMGMAVTAGPLAARATAVGGQIFFAKTARPPTPGGMSLSEFGETVMAWGRGSESARAQMGNLTREGLEKAGVSFEMAQEWATFYLREAARVPGNPSAAGRADLMQRAADLLRPR